VEYHYQVNLEFYLEERMYECWARVNLREQHVQWNLKS